MAIFIVTCHRLALVILLTCSFALYVFMHGTNTEAPTDIPSQLTIMRMPSGSKSYNINTLGRGF